MTMPAARRASLRSCEPLQSFGRATRRAHGAAPGASALNAQAPQQMQSCKGSSAAYASAPAHPSTAAPSTPEEPARKPSMPRRTIRRLLPKPHAIRDHKVVAPAEPHACTIRTCAPEPHSVSVAAFVGVFVALLPIPMQMLVAAAGAIWLRCNITLSVRWCAHNR